MEVTGRMAREYGLTDLKIMGVLGDDIIDGIDPGSYTHLDVYKRQE